MIPKPILELQKVDGKFKFELSEEYAFTVKNSHQNNSKNTVQNI